MATRSPSRTRPASASSGSGGSALYSTTRPDQAGSPYAAGLPPHLLRAWRPRLGDNLKPGQHARRPTPGAPTVAGLKPYLTAPAPIISRPSTAAGVRPSTAAGVRPSTAVGPRPVSPLRRPAFPHGRAASMGASPASPSFASPGAPSARSPGRFVAVTSPSSTQAAANSQIFESAQSRLHHLHLQALRAALRRDFTSLVSLRTEMLAFARLIGGRRSPEAVLASLRLAEAYLQAGQPRQAREHATPLLVPLEGMAYSQGSFDAHMLLGRAQHALALEQEQDSRDELRKGAPSQTTIANATADAAKAYAKATRHFQTASALTSKGDAFFMHTTIVDPAQREQIAAQKALASGLGLAHTLAASGQRAQQQETLTSCWESLDAHLTQRAREQRERETADANAGVKQDTTPEEREQQAKQTDINTAAQSLPLYLSLGECFFAIGDDANAIDNLRRAIAVAEAHPIDSFACALVQLPADGTAFPHPSNVSYPMVADLADAVVMLARSLARSGQHDAAVVALEQARIFLRQLGRFNLLLNAFYNSPRKSAPSSSSLTSSDRPEPLPTHTPTESTAVSHGVIDAAWAAMLTREWAFGTSNSPRVYDFATVQTFASRHLLQVERDLANVHAERADYEQAAFHQEEVCVMLEHGVDPAASTSSGGGEEDADASSPPRNPLAPPTGLYSLEVARGHRRLGALYVAAGQPRSARAYFQLSLRIVETMYAVKKVHDVRPVHQSAAAIAAAAAAAAKQKRRGSMPVRLPTSGFGGTLPYTFRTAAEEAALAAIKAEERLIPPAVLKLMADLRKQIKQIQHDIKHETATTAALMSNSYEDEEESTYFTSSAPQHNASASAPQQDDDAYEAEAFEDTAAATNEDAQSTEVEPPAAVTPVASPARSRPRSGHRQPPASTPPRNPRTGSATPQQPHVGGTDHLLGSSGVFAEALELRSAAAGDETEARKARRSAYDAFELEHGDVPPEEVKTSRKLRPLSAVVRRPQVEIEDGAETITVSADLPTEDGATIAAAASSDEPQQPTPDAYTGDNKYAHLF